MPDDAPPPPQSPAPPPPETPDSPETPGDAKATRDDTPPRGFLGKLWHEWVKPLGLVILVVTAVRSSLFDWNDVPSGSMKPTILEGDRIVVNKLAYGFNLPFNGPKIDLPLLPTFDNPLDFLPGWKWSQPKRGDIVTFWNPTPDLLLDLNTPDPDDTKPNPSSGIRMVKRVVGLPGDTIRVVDGRLEITDKDGNRVPITYADHADGPYKAEPTQGLRLDRATGRTTGKNVQAPVAFVIEDLGGVPHFAQFLQASGGWTPGGHMYRTIPRDGTVVTLTDSDDPDEDVYFMVGDNRDNSRDSRAYFAEDRDPENDGPIFVRGEHITGKAKFIAVSFDGSWLKPVGSRFFRAFDAEARAASE